MGEIKLQRNDGTILLSRYPWRVTPDKDVEGRMLVNRVVNWMNFGKWI